MKKYSTRSLFILLFLDIIFIFFIESLSWIIRFRIFPKREDIFWAILPFIIIIRISYLYIKGFYKNSFSSILEILFRSISNITTTSVIIIAVTFINRQLSFSRLVFLLSWFFTFFYIFISRLFVFLIYKSKKENFIILGDEKSVNRVLKEIVNSNKVSGIIKGIISDHKRRKTKILKILWKTSLKNFLKKPDRFGADAFLLVMDNLSEKEKTDIVSLLDRLNIPYYIVPTFYEIITGKVEPDPITGYIFMEPVSHPIRIEERFLKRLFDICFSLTVLILFLPVGIIISILILITSGPPVIYKQIRVGRYGKPFIIYKFRTMVKNADKIGPVLTQKNDNRITTLGKFLRRTSLDEFPQFLNVLKGDMSVVGPRPEVPEIVKTYTDIQKEVLKVRPGITGLPQISGRQDLPLDVKLKMDLNYIKNYSFLTDLRIILRTAFSFWKTRGAF